MVLLEIPSPIAYPAVIFTCIVLFIWFLQSLIPSVPGKLTSLDAIKFQPIIIDSISHCKYPHLQNPTMVIYARYGYQRNPYTFRENNGWEVKHITIQIPNTVHDQHLLKKGATVCFVRYKETYGVTTCDATESAFTEYVYDTMDSCDAAP